MESNIKTITLYTVKELSQLLKVSQRSIYRWIEEGKLHAYILGDGFLTSERQKTKVVIPDWALKEFLKLNTPDETIDKLKKHQNLLLETLRKLQKEKDPKTLQENLIQIINIILN